MEKNSLSASREMLASRLGFILLTAGCSIGLGNVWRFPYIAGQYGGGFFVLIYIFFLVLLGFPVMVMELSIGRGGQLDLVGCYRTLKNPKSKFPWEKPGLLFFSGNLVLLMFYTVVTGWLLAYTWFFLSGKLTSLKPEQCEMFFSEFLASPGENIFFTYLAIAITVFICASGLKAGVERVTKFMMIGLLLLLVALAIQAMRLPHAAEGIRFFLLPDAQKMTDNGLWQAIHAAMTQAFFTLSLGVGSIAICGSYINRSESLPKETTIIILLDTFVAVMAGLIIFPSCFAFGVAPGQGPSLIFITLSKIFMSMSYGGLRGTIFFLFLTIAAMTTLVAVAENLIAFGIDELHLTRKKSTAAVGCILFLTSLPCILGFNLWRSFEPLGKGTNILDLEDFIISDNLLPLGAFLIVLFCTRKSGWGYDNFMREANTGSGFHFPKIMRFYIFWILPAIIILIWGIGIVKRFHLLNF